MTYANLEGVPFFTKILIYSSNLENAMYIFIQVTKLLYMYLQANNFQKVPFVIFLTNTFLTKQSSSDLSNCSFELLKTITLKSLINEQTRIKEYGGRTAHKYVSYLSDNFVWGGQQAYPKYSKIPTQSRLA